MSSRHSPYAKGPKDLTPPRHPAASKSASLEKEKSHTFPPDSTSSSNNRTAEPGVYDQEEWRGESENAIRVASILGKQRTHSSTGNHEGEETNGEDGNGKGKEKGKGKKKAKKSKKRGELVKLLLKEGEKKRKKAGS
ncbi:hypothetical protein BCON_0245g00110 [Botryotinia convoluta]|uniref:Uncharacterized protein n=1 Tax=Botryotinia convoluta TaxID=54673 RepID=A0A4Z1HLW6_9HELO|nr:hypothetical protein BCON_0245g00110 [Botryotinia convoluta]